MKMCSPFFSTAVIPCWGILIFWFYGELIYGNLLLEMMILKFFIINLRGYLSGIGKVCAFQPYDQWLISIPES
jgi:hypothetical protein